MSCSCLRLSVYKARRVAKQTSHLPCKCALVTDNGTALCTQLASQKHGVIVESGLESLLAACRRSLAWVQRLGSKEFQTWLSSQTPSCEWRWIRPHPRLLFRCRLLAARRAACCPPLCPPLCLMLQRCSVDRSTSAVDRSAVDHSSSEPYSSSGYCAIKLRADGRVDKGPAPT